VATSAIYSEFLTNLLLYIKFSTTLSTAKLIPLLKSIGFMPAETLLHPSLNIALANTVAVVVPSPASSFVF